MDCYLRLGLFGLLGCGFCGLLYAEPYWVEPDMRVEAIISLHQLNRIKVLDDRIAQVFGDEDKFSVETDTENGQIFIKPKDEKPLFLTITTENGDSIDLALNPVEMDAQTIVLKTMPLEQKLPLRTEPLTKRVVDLIRAMNEGIAIDGFRTLKAIKEECLESLTLELQSIYQGDDMSGEIWNIKNRSNKTQHLREKLFATEADILGLALKTDTVEPNASTTLFKVRKHD